MMSRTLGEIVQDAVDEFNEWVNDNPTGDDPNDIIHEIADTSVPDTATLMQLAADNLSLAQAEPELGPAFDGTPTPVNIVAANVYEAVTEALYDRWRAVEEEREDE